MDQRMGLLILAGVRIGALLDASLGSFIGWFAGAAARERDKPK